MNGEWSSESFGVSESFESLEIFNVRSVGKLKF